MRSFFDSNVLIAAIHQAHRSHQTARGRLLATRAAEEAAAISQHALAETYAVLTAMPGRPRMSATFVRSAIIALTRHMDVIELTAADYWQGLAEAESRGVIGGTFYDVLHAQAAINWKADFIVTYNTKHLYRILEGSNVEVVEP